MNININKTVSYNVQNVLINNVTLAKDISGNLLVTVPFTWTDSTNKIIRIDRRTYTSAQLVESFSALGQDFTPIATALISLIPTTGSSGVCNLILTDSMTAIKGYSGIMDNQPQWVTTILDNSQLVAAIAPVTTSQLTDMLSALTVSLTQ